MHHAYLLIGDFAEAERFFHSFWAERGEVLRGSPDFFPSSVPVFGIDEARALNAQAVRKAFGARKIFLISPERITREAQNALLKTFEDPYEATHFFLVARGEELILPTLRSRMQMVKVGDSVSLGKPEAARFLSLPLKDRLNFARKFAEAEKNLSAFLDDLLSAGKKSGASPEKIKNIYEARLVSDDRGVASRLILEHLSLVLP